MSWLDTVEARALGRLQRSCGRRPVTRSAQALSSAGEHAWLWLALSALGAALDRRRRRAWAEVFVATFLAHASAVVLKRVVRRPRPNDPGVQILDATPSRLSFPSAHAASTTAAAVAAAPLVGGRVTAPVAVAMVTARMLLGVHYPTDVTVGALLGAASARAVPRAARALLR